MNVVEMLIVDVVKENAAITMVSRVFCTANPKRHIETADFQILYQRNVTGATNGRFVLALSSGDLNRFVAIAISDFPCIRVKHLPPVCALLEIVFKNDLIRRRIRLL